MIDYLERLFALPAANEEGEEEIPAVPGVTARSEQVEFLRPVIPAGEEPRFLSTKPLRDVEFPRGAAVRAVEEFLAAPEGEREKLTIRRPAREREGEGLERRLRRDSRRFDSGFYRY